MTTEQTFESTINHRANAAIAAAVEHLRPRLVRVVDGAARPSAQAAAPVIADAVRAASPPLGTAARRLAETIGKALAEADERSPSRRQQRALEALRASVEDPRCALLERPGAAHASVMQEVCRCRACQSQRSG